MFNKSNQHIPPTPRLILYVGPRGTGKTTMAVSRFGEMQACVPEQLAKKETRDALKQKSVPVHIRASSTDVLEMTQEKLIQLLKLGIESSSLSMVVELDSEATAEAVADYFVDCELVRHDITQTTWFRSLSPTQQELVVHYAWMPIAVHSRILSSDDSRKGYLHAMRKNYGLLVGNNGPTYEKPLSWQLDMIERLRARRSSTFFLRSTPGQAKTTGVRTAATLLDYELIEVDANTLFSSKMGATAQNFHRLFDALTNFGNNCGRTCLVFIDEADRMFPALNDSSAIEREVAAAKSVFNNWRDFCRPENMIVILAANRALESSVESRCQRIEVRLTGDDLLSVIRLRWPKASKSAKAIVQLMKKHGCYDLRVIEDAASRWPNGNFQAADLEELIYYRIESADPSPSLTSSRIDALEKKFSMLANAVRTQSNGFAERLQKVVNRMRTIEA